MKKLVVFSCILAMAAVGTQASAQMFKKFQQSSSNFAKILRQEIQSKHPMLMRKPVVRPSSAFKATVPETFALSQQTVLKPIQMPTRRTLISSSYVNQISKIMQNCRPAIRIEEAQEMFTWKWVGVGTSAPVGKAFYDNPTDLARDLDTLYEGTGATVLDAQGYLVRLYELPVDNILYKPQGASGTITLTSNNYFVVYNPDLQTGQLIERNAQTEEAFSDSFGNDDIPQGISSEVSPEQAQQILQYLKEQTNKSTNP